MATVTALTTRQPRRRPRPRRTTVPVLGGAPAAFAECRALGHEWHHLNKGRPATGDQLEDLGLDRPMGVEYGSVCFVSNCGSCGTTRTRWMGRRGQRHRPQYRYPEGYQRRGEDERMSVAEWTEAWIAHTLDDEAVEA